MLIVDAPAQCGQTSTDMLPSERAVNRTASAIFKRLSLRTYSTYSLVRIRPRSFIASALRPPSLRCALNSIRLSCSRETFRVPTPFSHVARKSITGRLRGVPIIMCTVAICSVCPNCPKRLIVMKNTFIFAVSLRIYTNRKMCPGRPCQRIHPWRWFQNQPRLRIPIAANRSRCDRLNLKDPM